MKKKLSILLCVVALAFGIFSFSANSLAVENEKSYEVGEVIFESDILYEPEPVAGFDSTKSYEAGEIFFESDTLYEPDPTNAAINKPSDTITPYGFYIYKDKTISAFYPTLRDVPESRYYEEYTDGYWYRGTLPLKSVVASGSGYTATFSRTLGAWVD